MTPDHAQRHPVEGLARLLLQHAREDPALLARSQIGAVSDAWPAPRPVLRPSPARRPADEMPLRARTAEPERHEMEQLVSIAVACARRAEDASRQAEEIGWMARRRMSVAAAIAAVAAVVILGGIGSAMVQRDDKQAALGAVVSAVHEVSDLQQRTATQLAGISVDVAALRDRAASMPASSAPAMPAATDTTPEMAASDAATSEVATPETASEPISELAQPPPLPPATYVPIRAYPPASTSYLPADALRAAPATPRHFAVRRSHNVSPISFLSRLFAHR